MEEAVAKRILWGDFFINKRKGDKVWKENHLEYKIENLTDTEGGFQITKKDKKIIPVMTLSLTEHPYEVLITMNHETVHYANSQRLLRLISKNHKLKDCITEFQWAELKDETKAFHSEIKFWNNAPSWFRNGLHDFKFDSKLLELKQTNYEEYYKVLKTKLKSDGNFIVKRYVELGKAPQCAIKLL